MLVRTPTDLGALIRDRRKQLKIDQAAFAKRVGVSRQWVIEIERGHARAEFALVLRALDALDIQLDTSIREADSRRPDSVDMDAVDIDAIVARAKKNP